jgi:maltose alpha-D-glucosyltransferase/alpha-amylase
LAQDLLGGFLSGAELLGRRVGELHVALANLEGESAFAPEPFTRLYQRGLYQSMRSRARATLESLRSHDHRLNDDARMLATRLFECETYLYAKLSELTRDQFDAKRIRCHGDFNLGQVLYTGKDFVFIDFEGEPERPVSERRIKSSPLRDVAGMLWSLHLAAQSALRGHSQSLIVQHAAVPVERWANYWTAWVSAAFLRTYLNAVEHCGIVPKERFQLESLLRAFVLEKALDELQFELQHRPDWATISLEAICHNCDCD